MKNTENNKTMRLHVFLSRCGIGSRRKCEEIISSKRVSVNGTIVSSQGVIIGENDVVHLDHKPVKPVTDKLYVALNKPVRYLCSNSDDFGRQLAVDLIQTDANVRLFHVGRLDYMSSGLVLYTNDGDFAQRVTHPSFEIEKEYVVMTKKRIDEEFLKEFRKGIVIENVRYKLNRYEIITQYKVRLWLNEGKNREIRKAFEHAKLAIDRIHRVRIGIVSIKGIASGQFRTLTRKEIRWFYEQR